MLDINKNYKLIIFLASTLLIFSCNKINPEQTDTSNKNIISINQENIKDENNTIESKVHLGKEACGEKTCEMQKYLEKLARENKLNLSKTTYFQKRFSSLLDRYKNKDALMKAADYQKFVDDFNAEYFPCKWKVEICKNTNSYSYDEQNYIWYLFLPAMVSQEYQNKVSKDNISDEEAIIQSIRRKYYATYDEKEAMIQVWKDKLLETAKKIDTSKIDKERLKTDKEYFNEIILKPDVGIYDTIIQKLLSPIPWQEQGELLDTTYFGINLFISKINELGISKEQFYEYIGTSENNFKILDEKSNLMNKKYGLTKLIPLDRYLRHDEIANYFFANIKEFNKKGDFNQDVLEIKHYLLLQFAYPDTDLYNMPERAAKFNSINNFLSENILKYSKYMNIEIKP